MLPLVTPMLSDSTPTCWPTMTGETQPEPVGKNKDKLHKDENYQINSAGGEQF